MICPHCVEFMNQAEDLREQLRFYQDADKTSRELAQTHKLMSVFGMSEQCAWMVSVMYRAQHPVLKTWIEDNRGNRKRDEIHSKLVHTQICRLRKRLPAGSVENVWGHGYKLTEIGRAAVREALGD